MWHMYLGQSEDTQAKGPLLRAACVPLLGTLHMSYRAGYPG